MSQINKKNKKITRRVDMDLLARSIPGVWVYMVLWPIIFWPYDFQLYEPLFAWGIAISMASVSLIRLIHRAFSDKLYQYSPKIWLGIFTSCTFLHSVVLGFLFYMAIADERFAPVSFVTVLAIGGVSSGVISTLAPRITIPIVNISAILLPGVIASFMVKQPNMAFLIAVYFVYLLLFAFRTRKEYFRAFDNELALQKQRAKLQQLNKVDPLTNIYNRGHFNTAIELQWNHGIRSQEQQSLLLIDVDHFKAINDKYGHLIGDDCLVFIADIISKTAKRKTDLVARYGGEEFVILLSDTALVEAMTLAEEIRKAIQNKPFEFGDLTLNITVSIGAACVTPTPGSSSNILIDKADKALYVAKNSGRNNVCQYVSESVVS